MGYQENGNLAVPEMIPYSIIGDVELKLHLFRTAERSEARAVPAVLFFFGGGWVNGTPEQFYPQARALASRGIIGICAEYRVQSIHGTTPFEAIDDAMTAMAWLRANCGPLGIDPERIAAAGSSAGGLLAACTVMLPHCSYGSAGEAIQAADPAALILFQPVVDTSRSGYGESRFDGRAEEASPVRLVRPGMPPVLIMHGTEDQTVPFENAERFERLMQENGNTCRLVGYPGQDHGFFNYRDGNNPYYQATLLETFRFLEEIGWLDEMN